MLPIVEACQSNRSLLKLLLYFFEQSHTSVHAMRQHNRGVFALCRPSWVQEYMLVSSRHRPRNVEMPYRPGQLVAAVACHRRKCEKHLNIYVQVNVLKLLKVPHIFLRTRVDCLRGIDPRLYWPQPHDHSVNRPVDADCRQQCLSMVVLLLIAVVVESNGNRGDGRAHGTDGRRYIPKITVRCRRRVVAEQQNQPERRESATGFKQIQPFFHAPPSYLGQS
jgi:hypothetical protein